MSFAYLYCVFTFVGNGSNSSQIKGDEMTQPKEQTEKLRERFAEIVYRKDLQEKPAIPFAEQDEVVKAVYYEWADALRQVCKEARLKFVPDEWKLDNLCYLSKRDIGVRCATESAINSQIKEIEV